MFVRFSCQFSQLIHHSLRNFRDVRLQISSKMTTAALLLYRVTAPLLLLACDALTLPMHPATPHALRATAPRMLFGGGGKGGEGGGLNMMETIKKAQQVGVKVKALQEELAQTEIEAISADGGCTVVISGAQVPISVDVTEALLAKGSKAVSEAGACVGSLSNAPRLPCSPSLCVHC